MSIIIGGRSAATEPLVGKKEEKGRKEIRRQSSMSMSELQVISSIGLK
jgi:hypothetical protein